MRKAPAVQFYAGDFLTGTALMSNAEVGLYIRLLCLQVEHGAIPDDEDRIVQAYGEGARVLWPVVRRKFAPGPQEGTLVNERMAEALAARDAFRQKQSQKGKLSAERRSNNGATEPQPRFNRGSTVVEPLGDGEGDTPTQKRRERARRDPDALTWPRWAGPQTRAKWEEFIAYRRTEHRNGYKSAATEQKALNLCAGYFPSGPAFVAALDHTMARGWLFPVDPAEHTYPQPPAADGQPLQRVWNARA